MKKMILIGTIVISAFFAAQAGDFCGTISAVTVDSDDYFTIKVALVSCANNQPTGATQVFTINKIDVGASMFDKMFNQYIAGMGKRFWIGTIGTGYTVWGAALQPI